MSLLPSGLSGLPVFDVDALCDALAGPGFTALRLVDSEMLAALRSEAQALWQDDALTPAGIGRADDHELIARIRRDKTKWLDGSSPGQLAYLAFAEAMRRDINARLMLGLFAFEAHFAVYEAGAFYKRHLDSFRGARNRVLSTVLYLNPDWRDGDGGHLRIYGQGDQVLTELRPEFGTLAVFLSEEIPHEVTVSHRERFSIAGWHRCNDRGLAPALQVKALPIAP